MSLPARRITQRSAVSGAETRKLRFVIPPLSGRSVSSRPASSGTRCIAADELVAQLAAEDLVVGRRSCAADVERRRAEGPSRRLEWSGCASASADHRLAGRGVGLDSTSAARPRSETT